MVVARPHVVSHDVRTATRATPGNVVYVFDVSWSMQRPLAGRRRIDWAIDCFRAHLDRLRRLSRRSGVVEDRYRIAALAYSDSVFDLLGGLQPLSVVPETPPVVELHTATRTAAAFEYAAEIVAPSSPSSPIPLVLHFTDGSPTDGADTLARARDLTSGETATLVHVCCADLPEWMAVTRARDWHGVTRDPRNALPHLRRLAETASPLADPYRQLLRNEGFTLVPDAVMVFPVRFSEMVQHIAPPTTDRLTPSALEQPA
jgi:hypothetical protein